MIKDSLIMSISNLFLMLIGLMAQYFLSHYLSQNEYGEFQLILSWIVVVGFFSLNSFNSVVLKASTQKYSVFFRKASIICFLGSFLGSFTLIIIGLYFETEIKHIFLISAIFFPFYSGINLSQNYFTGNKEYKKFAFLNTITQVVVTASQIFILLYLPSTTNILITTLLITSLINISATIYIINKVKTEKIDANKEKELSKYGIYLTFISLIPSLAQRIQFIILNSYTTPAVLAIYAAAQLFPSKIIELLKSILIPFAVHIVSREKEYSIRITKKATLLLFLIGIISSVLCAILLPFLIKLIFGNQYNDSIFYSVILLSDVLFLPINSVISSVIVFQGFKKINTTITTIRSLISIVLYFILIPLFDIYGIIITVIFVSIVTLVTNTIWLFRLPSKKNVQLILCLKDSKLDDEKFKILKISNNIDGINIIKTIETDYLIKGEKYPWWVYPVAKLSFTKYIELPLQK